MLELDEDERPDFAKLSSALPEFSHIQEYFYKLENGLLSEEGEDEDDMNNVEFYEDMQGDDYDPNNPEAFVRNTYNQNDDVYDIGSPSDAGNRF